jgi:hypothetical protein
MFIIGERKVDMWRTLDHFGVNRVKWWTIREWLSDDNANAEYYSLRSFNPAWAGFGYALSSCAIIDLIRERKVDDMNYICETLKVYDRANLVYNGEVGIYPDDECSGRFGTYRYIGFINRQRGISLREASKHPTKIIQSRHDIPRAIWDYMWSMKIVGYVMEFTMFDVPVGIQQRPLVIWEIRKY